MEISIFIALGAGIISFVSPCVLPMVPVYLSSLTGPGLWEAQTDRRRQKRLALFSHSLFFVLGLGMVFTLLGAGVGLLGFSLAAHLALLRKIAGGLLIFFGLMVLASTWIPWLNYEKRLPFRMGERTGYARSFLTGGIFALAWTPCVGPVLGGILTLAWSSQTAGQGALLLAVYSIGLGIPFLIIGVAFDALAPFLHFLRRYSNWVYLLSALLLIVVGILVLFNKLAIFSTGF